MSKLPKINKSEAIQFLATGKLLPTWSWLEDQSETIRKFSTRIAAPPFLTGSGKRRRRRSPTPAAPIQIPTKLQNGKTMKQKNHQIPETQRDRGFHMKSGVLRRGRNSTFLTRPITVTAIAAITAAAAVKSVYAAIDNTATATGTYTTADDTVSGGDSQSVPVVPANRDLSIVKTVVAGSPTVANGTDPLNVDAGDTITYRYVITNDGNVTETSITPVDTGPTFNLIGGTGTMGSFSVTAGSAASLAPGASVTFEATYTMSNLDVYRAAGITDAVDNSATASSADHTDLDADTAETTIPANPALSIGKVAVLTELFGNTGDGNAEVGDTITYTYTVTNSGNVALTDVTVTDDHENGDSGAIVLVSSAGTSTADAPFDETELTADALGLNDDTTSGTDGSWDTLGPEGQITFTYVHTVTQNEVDDQ